MLGPEQIISPDEISDEDYNGGIFAKFFGWLGFGGGADLFFDQTPMSPYEAERLREEAENSFYMDVDGSSSSMCVDIDHPAYNPPMFLGEGFLPPDK